MIVSDSQISSTISVRRRHGCMMVVNEVTGSISMSLINIEFEFGPSDT